jgi:hypothetical protein
MNLKENMLYAITSENNFITNVQFSIIDMQSKYNTLKNCSQNNAITQ